MFSGEFRKHPDLEGKHALLSASKYSWLRYDDVKLVETFHNHMNAARGTELHEFAHNAIRLGIRLPDTGATLNSFVNDGIDWRMKSEVVLAYSWLIFGTADAIRFSTLPKLDIYSEYTQAGIKYILRVSDYKSGKSPTKFDQLLIYAALFFLEYKEKPEETLVELRIYQNDEIDLYIPTTGEVISVMDHIQHCDQILEDLRNNS